MSINTISACNIEFDATVFRSAQNKPNFSQISPMSLSALRFWPRWYLDGDQAPGRQFRRKVCDLLPDFRTTDKLRDLVPDSEGAMRKTRFTEEQMVAIVREADRERVAEVAKRHGISGQAIYLWRQRFGSLQANDVRRLKQLEVENERLKKLVAERDLEIEVMKEVASKNW